MLQCRMDRRVAVIVNARAAGANDATIAAIRGCAGPRLTVDVTSSIEEARAIVIRHVRAGVDVVLFAGGDGSVVVGLSQLADVCRGYGLREPIVGVLRLGRANTLAAAMSTPPGTLDGIAAQIAAARDRKRGAQKLPMLHVAGLRAPFCGVGVDVGLLEDRAEMTTAIQRVPLARRFASGALGLAATVAFRSAPRMALGKRAHVVVRNLGSLTRRIGADGAPFGPTIGRGEIMWEGACTTCAASTIRTAMFPHARQRDDRFAVRATDASALEMMTSASVALAGRAYNPSAHDFLVDHIRFEVDGHAAFAAGGELLGARSSLEVSLAPPIHLL